MGLVLPQSWNLYADVSLACLFPKMRGEKKGGLGMGMGVFFFWGGGYFTCTKDLDLLKIGVLSAGQLCEFNQGIF